MNKKFVFSMYFILTLFVACASLFAPNPDLAAPQISVSFLGREIMVPSNTDSGEWTRLVVKFPVGFVEDNVRMTRPLYPTLAVPLFSIMRHFVPTSERLEQKFTDRTDNANRDVVWDDVHYKDFIAAWISLVLVNIIMVLASLWLLYLFFREYFSGVVIAFILPLFVLASDLCKTYILVPQTEMFDFLIPAFTMWLCMKIDTMNKNGETLWSDKCLYVSSLCLGILFFGKATVYCALVVLLFMLCRRVKLSKIFIAGALMSLPFIFHFLTLKYLGVGLREIGDWQQGTWFIPYVQNHDMLGLVFAVSSRIFKEIMSIGIMFRYELFFIVLMLIFTEAKIETGTYLKIYLVLLLLFWLYIGLLLPRMMYTLFPCILYIMGQCFAGLGERNAKFAALAALLFQFSMNYFMSSFSLYGSYLM